MKIDKKSIAVGMLAIGLVTTAGAGVTAAAQDGSFGFGGNRGGGHAEIAANLIGVTAEEFQARVENGEKPNEILEAAGVSRDDMQAAHEQQMQERMAQAVADGRITQEEADEKAAQHAARKATRDAAHTALENNDFAAWTAAVAGTPQADKVDATTFSKLVEAHNLREAGDHEGARAIMEELGLEKGGKGHKGKGRGAGPRG